MYRRVIEGFVFILLGVYLLGYTLPGAWKTLNTDFPNYYLAARLTRESVDPSRAYEWIWLQREKDHRNIDQRIVGLVPITPFSTLAMWPLTKLPPLEAKHAWLLLNLALLLPIAWLLRAVSGLSLLQIGCLLGLSLPLHRNLLYGQYYILLLGILTGACWAAQRQRNYLAGSLVGIGAAVKVFPIVLTLHFLRRKNWQALLACLLTGLVCLLISTSVFGWSLHRTYLLQVLPWTLHGDALDPYNLASSSLSTLLHRLFIYEPQWNPHPAINAPWLFAILHPTLQLAILAPAVLWIETGPWSPARTALEWSALLLATLTLTPLPASYHFTVLVLPVAVLCGRLLQERSRFLLATVIVLYLAVGYPGWNSASVDGWGALLHVKRLYWLVLLTLTTFHLLMRSRTAVQYKLWWLTGGGLVLSLSIAAGLHHQHGLFDDYAYRLPMPAQVLLASEPVPLGSGIQSIALAPTGYQLAPMDGAAFQIRDGDTEKDELSLAASGEELWTESVGLHSLLEPVSGSFATISDAESPAIVSRGSQLAFLRQIGGRKQLFVRDLIHPGILDRQVTTVASPWNLEEIASSPSGTIIVAATQDQGKSRLYIVKGVDQLEPIAAGEARYPAVSPDGRWLAFSSFHSGFWNLSLQDLTTGAMRRLTAVPCDQTEPAWLSDSRTLLYSSDCGRAFGFAAICRRRFLP